MLAVSQTKFLLSAALIPMIPCRKSSWAMSLNGALIMCPCRPSPSVLTLIFAGNQFCSPTRICVPCTSGMVSFGGSDELIDLMSSASENEDWAASDEYAPAVDVWLQACPSSHRSLNSCFSGLRWSSLNTASLINGFSSRNAISLPSKKSPILPSGPPRAHALLERPTLQMRLQFHPSSPLSGWRPRWTRLFLASTAQGVGSCSPLPIMARMLESKAQSPF